ncbi:MAG TPA: RNA methyltransferase [Opitutaceae bacterium]|jgi:TrmH RNA methyltransferase
MRDDEIAICGLSAVRARFRRSPASINRLFFDLPTSRKVGIICRAMAAAQKPYRCVEPAELEKISGSVHHGGIVAVAQQAPVREPKADDLASWHRRRESMVVLDRIGNSHNLGAIARSAAFFGVPRIVISGEAGAARPGPAAFRVAEGGLDSVEVWRVPAAAPFLRLLSAAGFEVVGAATRGGKAAAGSRGPWALVLGNEEEGLSAEAATACTRLVTLRGSNLVESLNVSAAAAVLIHDLSSRPARSDK